MENEVLLKTFNSQGWVLFDSLLPQTLIQALRPALDQAIVHCGELQRAGLGQILSGTAHHLLGQAPVFQTLLEQAWLDAHMQTLLEGPYILNSFGGVANPPEQSAYVHQIHRDQRTFIPDFRLMLNLLVMLDDFLPENGATWLFSGSQTQSSPPSQATFSEQAQQICAPAGSLLLFDSRLWHAAGQNKTQTVRRGLTLTYSRPFLKPQFDYLGHVSGALSQHLKQILGYYARVPASLEQWYVPPEARFYRPGQG
jgi:hypothetical protein